MAHSTPGSSRLIVGNWKMNGGADQLVETAKLAQGVTGRRLASTLAICPPATLLHRLAEVLGNSGVFTGGQDCHPEACGAFTGDLSAGLLVEAGARFVIVGHSERRQGHGEDDVLVARKASAALGAGLLPIICVGETLAEREGGQAFDVVRRQLRGSLPPIADTQNFAVAYEPVWAIGTGARASEADIAEMHRTIRGELLDMTAAAQRAPILYGGSVQPDGAAAILAVPDVGGVLVGGASLRAESFLGIVAAAEGWTDG